MNVLSRGGGKASRGKTIWQLNFFAEEQNIQRILYNLSEVPNIVTEPF